MLKKTVLRGHDSAGPSHGGPGRLYLWPAETGGVWSRTSLCGSIFKAPIQALAGFVRAPPEFYVYSAETGTSPGYGGQSGFFLRGLLHGVRVQQVDGGRVRRLYGTTFRLCNLHPVGTGCESCTAASPRRRRNVRSSYLVKRGITSAAIKYRNPKTTDKFQAQT